VEDIELALQSWTRTRERISIQRNEVNKDIGAYIKDKVRNGDEFKRWQYRPDVQQQIEYSLMEKADGMYVRFVLTGRV
jgi:regulatory protein YycI of two-component signal transduction system YycFG